MSNARGWWQIDRRHTPAQASRIVALAKQFVHRGVVGIDLCGDPAVPVNPALGPIFEEARRIPGLGMTLHFAEAECSASDEELDMLLGWQPDRIGHVIHVSERVRQEIMKRPGIGLELCLSCNVHAGMICGGFESHHFREWWKVDETTVILSVSSPSACGTKTP
jgi:adenosine deaminase